MQNNIQKNSGKQYFQENNYYGNGYYSDGTQACVSKPRKVMKLSTAVLSTIVGLLADIIALFCGVIELNEKGLGKMLFSYELHLYLIIIGVIFVYVAVMAKILWGLMIDKTYGPFLLKDKQIYKIRFKKCPICGESCGGTLRIETTESGTFCVCHRDKTHKWKLEYDRIMRKI